MSMLEVVNKAGKTLHLAERETIHRQGLLHKEINMWFYTPDNKIIFQRRSATKDTFPNTLGATVGGHVEVGSSWIDTVVEEAKEETGLTINHADITLIQQIYIDAPDKSTGNRNHALQNIYAYKYTGKLEDLQPEEGEATGFDAWDIDALSVLTPEQEQQFTFPMLPQYYPAIFNRIKELNA